jgi:hypothetical protein
MNFDPPSAAVHSHGDNRLWPLEAAVAAAAAGSAFIFGAEHRIMTPDDREYYLRRAMEEEGAAEAATSLSARWRHEELAFLYRSRANGADPTQPELVVRGLPGDFAL